MLHNTLTPRRITLFMGHYGSGKTNVAVNYAVFVKNSGHNTCIYDLDIVNPYFRTVDGKALLDKYGVKLVASDFAGSNLDAPAVPAANYAITDNKGVYAVADVGGDDRGSLAIGRYAPEILTENNFDMLLVVNKYRALTRDVNATLEIKDEIERACGMAFTGIVNNSNLGGETTAKTVLDSLPYCEQLVKETGLRIKFTAVKKDLCAELGGISNLFPLEIIKYGSWQ